jgi:Xaa-Pro dipeptidase
MTEDHILSEFLLNRSLQPNMVLTIEPGLYFNETMLQIWTQCPGYQKYFNLDILARYKCVGGVRIEDTVVITQDGHENLTKVPKQIHEIEQIMNHS